MTTTTHTGRARAVATAVDEWPLADPSAEQQKEPSGLAGSLLIGAEVAANLVWLVAAIAEGSLRWTLRRVGRAVRRSPSARARR